MCGEVFSPFGGQYQHQTRGCILCGVDLCSKDKNLLCDNVPSVPSFLLCLYCRTDFNVWCPNRVVLSCLVDLHNGCRQPAHLSRGRQSLGDSAWASHSALVHIFESSSLMTQAVKVSKTSSSLHMLVRDFVRSSPLLSPSCRRVCVIL